MPWTQKQHHLAQAVAHGWKPPASSGIHMSVAVAKKMASEGVKDSESAEGDKSKGGAAHERGESMSKEAREKKRLAQRKALAMGRR